MIKLVNADSREYLKEIEDESIDIIITDPPFGISYAEWDDVSHFFELEEEFYRVLKPNSFFIFWWSAKRLPDISRIKKFSYIWQIVVEFMSTYSKCKLGDRKYASVMVYGKGEPKVCYRRVDVMNADELPFACARIKSGEFKPTFANCQLLLMFTKEEDTVLDPFSGFGSMGLVCKYFNRNYIGIEIDEARHRVAEEIINTGKITKSIPELLSKYKHTTRRVEMEFKDE